MRNLEDVLSERLEMLGVLNELSAAAAAVATPGGSSDAFSERLAERFAGRIVLVAEGPDTGVGPVALLGASGLSEAERGAELPGLSVETDWSRYRLPWRDPGGVRWAVRVPGAAAGRVCWLVVVFAAGEAPPGRYRGVLGRVGVVLGDALACRRLLSEQAAAARRLARLNEELEARVEERTRELTESLSSLRAARDRVIQAEKIAVAGRIALGTAHEINNSLTVLQLDLSMLAGWVERLAGPGEDDAEMLQIAKEAQEATTAIGELVTELGRLDLPEQSGAPRRVELGPLVRSCARDLAGGGRIVVDPSCGDLVAWAPPGELRTAVERLLAFALHVGSGGPPAVRGVHGGLRVEVPGLRLREEDRARVFDPQLAVDRRAGGRLRLDLDLAVARHLLLESGGDLVLEEDGGGFRVSLPQPAGG